MSTDPTPPTENERHHAFEWLRELGLNGDDKTARLAYVAMQTMLSPTAVQVPPNGWRKEYIEGNGVDREVWVSPEGKCYDELPKQASPTGEDGERVGGDTYTCLRPGGVD